MPYLCELNPGQMLYLSHQGAQTRVTLATIRLGHQQQSSSCFSIGTWTAPPDVFCTPLNVVVRLHTDSGDRHLQIQGGSISWIHSSPPLRENQRVQVEFIDHEPEFVRASSSMNPPMKMEPMKMNDMSMGGMNLDNESDSQSSTSQSSASQSSTSQSSASQSQSNPSHPDSFDRGNLRMGNMQMSLNPMEMRMGDMEMRMDQSGMRPLSQGSETSEATSEQPSSQPSSSGHPRRFCSQCGAPITPSDRFCASCGTRLTS